MRIQGIITSWHDEKGFGFITSKEHDKIFVHIKSFIDINKRPELNQKVIFTLDEDNRGRVNAVEVKIIKMNSSIFLALMFFIFLGLWALIFNPPIGLFPYYAITSLITYFIYWWDKNKAKKGQWRTPENNLHFLALIGGWPGALIAQQTLRHKSSKKSFKIGLWLTIFINFIALLLIFTPLGNQLLEIIIQYFF